MFVEDLKLRYEDSEEAAKLKGSTATILALSPAQRLSGAVNRFRKQSDFCFIVTHTHSNLITNFGLIW